MESVGDDENGRRRAAHYSSVRSCLSCALAKQRCNGARPCDRCDSGGSTATCVDPPANYKRLMREGGVSAVRAAAARADARLAPSDATSALSGEVAAGTKRGRAGVETGPIRRMNQRPRMAGEADGVPPLTLDAVIPRMLPPRVALFSPTPEAATAVLRSFPPGLRALLLGAAAPVRDALIPRMSINSFVAFWRLQWQRMDSAAMLSSSPSFFREVTRHEPFGLDGLGALEAQLSAGTPGQQGVAPIPEDALAALLPAPDTTGMSDAMAAAVLEAHEMIVEEYASAAVQACPVPCSRVEWFRHAFTPRCSVSNEAMTRQFCTSLTGLAKAYASGLQMCWQSPDAAVKLAQAGIRTRNHFLHQYVVCAPVLQQVYDADDNFIGYRSFSASHVVVNKFHPDGRMRSTTIYTLDLSLASQALVSAMVTLEATVALNTLLSAPASNPELRTLQLASNAATGPMAILWQSRRYAVMEPVAAVTARATALSRVPAALRAPLQAMASTTFSLSDAAFTSAFVDSMLAAQLHEWHRVVALRATLGGSLAQVPELPSHDDMCALAQCVDVAFVPGGPRIQVAPGELALSVWSQGWTDASVLQPAQSYVEMCGSEVRLSLLRHADGAATRAAASPVRTPMPTVPTNATSSSSSSVSRALLTPLWQASPAAASVHSWTTESIFGDARPSLLPLVSNSSSDLDDDDVHSLYGKVPTAAPPAAAFCSPDADEGRLTPLLREMALLQ